MHKTLLGLGLLLGLSAPALAQVNTVPQIGLTTGYLPKTSYSAAFFGLVPVTTANTDQVCISGSATKTIRLMNIHISGTTATAPQTFPLLLLRRTAADSGGTAGTTTANPANTISKRDVNYGTATATLISYTAAPTVNDSSPTYIDSQAMTMPIVTSVLTAPMVNFDFAKDLENLVLPPTLVGTAAQICVQNGAALTNASAWSGSITWTEE